ncbi:hypothetical protein V6N13_098378 [Hibiscus sabdariffa]
MGGGNGESIDFWKDPWLCDLGPHVDHMLLPVSMNLQPTTINSMVYANGSWSWNRLEGILPEDVLLRLVATKPHISSNKNDWSGWKWNADMTFSIHSAYHMQHGVPSE